MEKGRDAAELMHVLSHCDARIITKYFSMACTTDGARLTQLVWIMHSKNIHFCNLSVTTLFIRIHLQRQTLPKQSVILTV